jgi:hypothetical protein
LSSNRRESSSRSSSVWFQRREFLRRLLQRELIDVLVLDVLQSLLPQIADADAARQLVPEQRPRRLRDQDLTAVTGRADARGPETSSPM